MPRGERYQLGVNWTRFYHPVKDDHPRVSVVGYGPQFLGLRQDPDVQGGPRAFTLAHPELFGGGNVSMPEGWFYWALLLELGDPGRSWKYQVKLRPGGSKVGSATPDFIISSSPRDIACRIVTPFFHTAAGPEKAATDLEQVFMLQDLGYDVLDAPSELYMHDESGDAVRRMARDIIAKRPQLVPGVSTSIGA